MQRTLLKCSALFVLVAAPTPACGQATGAPRATVILGIPGDVAVPLPVVGPPASHVADVADQMFLRLGFLKAGFQTVGDAALSPMLARSWRRIDPRTLDFDLDPRARWHDGQPVTSRDVVFTWRLMSNPRVGSDRTIVEPIESIDSTGPRSFRVRFRRPFREQLYLVGFNLQPLPAHLLEGMPAESISTSAFARVPVGNGPFRFERRTPGEFIELHANREFFMGRPTIGRVIFRVGGNPATRLNQLLSGEVDVLEMLQPAAVAQVRQRPELRVATFTSNMIVYGRFNLRAPTDSAQPHPILGDRAVRAALRGALDRGTLARGIYGPNAMVPDAAQSVLWSWVNALPRTSAPPDIAAVRAAFAAAGWRDADGDGILDRNGAPLRVGLMYPETSAIRHDFALQMQAMWRAAGVDAQIERIPGPVYSERRSTGRFDIEIVAINQDPSPISLSQGWSCAAAREPRSSNNARWCDPEFDRLLQEAATSGNPVAGYRRALARMGAEVPAVFLAAPYNNVAIHSRLENVQIWPIKPWTSLWQWRVRRGAELPRDR